MKASNEIAELLNGAEWLASVHNKVASTTSESISAAAIAIVAREVIAALQAEPVNVTDDMALAFHRALTDGGLPADDLEEIKTGLRAALANAAQPAKVPEARIIWALLTSLKDWKHAMEYTDLVTADMLLERIEWEIEQLTAAPTAGEGEIYECTGKGGRYERLGGSIGAGTSRGKDFVVYRNMETGQLFHREITDFAKRMRRITPAAGEREK